jgi:hypothetical protein
MADNDDKRDPGGTGEQPAGGAEEDLLGPYWAVMRRMRGADQPRPPTPEEEAARTFPGELVIATSAKRVLVRIQPDGRIIYGDEYTPDETAVELWTTIARRRADFEARMQYITLLELHVALLAVADQAYEAAQLATRNAMGNAETTEREREALRFREDLSRRALETRVHGMIEFAREFAAIRPDLLAQARRLIPGGQGGPGGGQGA